MRADDRRAESMHCGDRRTVEERRPEEKLKEEGRDQASLAASVATDSPVLRPPPRPPCTPLPRPSPLRALPACVTMVIWAVDHHLYAAPRVPGLSGVHGPTLTWELERSRICPCRCLAQRIGGRRTQEPQI